MSNPVNDLFLRANYARAKRKREANAEMSHAGRALSESKLTRSCDSSKHERVQRSVGVRRDPLVLLQVRGDYVLDVGASEQDLAEAQTLHLGLRERLRLLLQLNSFPVSFGRVGSVQVLL